MPRNTEESQSNSLKRRFLSDELNALLDSLLNLQMQISSMLLSSRMRSFKPSNNARNGTDIAEQLKDKIAHTVTESKTSGHASEIPSSNSIRRDKAAPAGSAVHTKQSSPELRLFIGLSNSLSKRVAAHKIQPSMTEKMEAKTMEYINKAMRLAKQGNAEGAKVNAELAESALKTVIEYMPEEEYQAFTKEVENRMKAIIGKQ